MKWFPKCEKWGDHYRSRHSDATAKEEDNNSETGHVSTRVETLAEDNLEVIVDDEFSKGAFDRIRMTGLL